MYFQALNCTSNPAEKAIIWAEVGWVYYYEKDYNRAIEAAENVLMQDNTYKALDDLYRVQGYAYLGLANYMLPSRYLQLSLENNSTDDKQQFVKYELGKLNFIQGDYDLALPYFIESLDYFQKNNNEYHLSILFYLGFINYYLNNFEKSADYFNKIIVAEPSEQRLASAKFGIAFLEFQKKNYLNVISLCEEIITLNKNFFDKESVGFLTAASYFYLGRKDIYGEYYHKMKDTYPNGRYNEELDRLNSTITNSPATDQ
jgi:tetratricopeptide (TPR) repeat protein